MKYFITTRVNEEHMALVRIARKLVLAHIDSSGIVWVNVERTAK